MEICSIPEIKKWLVDNKKMIYIGIILIVFGVILIPMYFNAKDDFENNEYELVSYVDKNNRKTKLYNRHVYLQTSDEPLFIGRDPENLNNGYYLFNIGQFGYVVYANINYIDSLEFFTNSNKYLGVSDKCNYMIQDMLIDYYSVNTTGYLNRSNFEEYVSIVYIDMTSFSSDILDNYFFGISFLFIFGGLFILAFVIETYLIKKSIKNLDYVLVNSIMEKVNNGNYSSFDKFKILLFDEYLVSINEGIKIFKLNEIVSISHKHFRYSYYIELCDINAKKHNISVTVLGHKKILDKFYKELLCYNGNINVK